MGYNNESNKLKSMKRLYFFVTILSMTTLAVMSQNHERNSLFNLKFGFAQYPGPDFDYYNEEVKYNNYRLDFGYTILNPIEIGAHLGYSRMIVTNDNENDPYAKVNGVFVGANLNIHLLDLVLDNSPVDLYFTGRYGGYFLPSPSATSYPSKGLYKEIRHGLGLSVDVFNGFGLYSEYSIEKFSFDSGVLRFGISYRI